MAATNDAADPERRKEWYEEDRTEVNEPMRNLLEKYANVPSEDVVKHVNNVVSAYLGM